MNDSSSTITQPVFYILLTLSIQKSHGYEIMQKVSQLSGGNVRLGPGTLYGALKRMLREQLIKEVEQKPSQQTERRRYYEITEKGRDILSTEVKRMQEILDLVHSHTTLNLDAIHALG